MWWKICCPHQFERKRCQEQKKASEMVSELACLLGRHENVCKKFRKQLAFFEWARGIWVDAFPMETAPHRPRSFRTATDLPTLSFALRIARRRAWFRQRASDWNGHITIKQACLVSDDIRRKIGPKRPMSHTFQRTFPPISPPPARATATSNPPRWTCNRYSRSRMDPSSTPPTRIKSDHREKINVEVRSQDVDVVVCPSSVDLFD